MNSDFSFLLLSIGAALVAGVVLGLLAAALFRRGMVPAAPSVPSAGTEILRIDGDPLSQKLVLRLSGVPAASADSIADAEVREHVRALMQLLASEPEKPAAPVAGTPASPDVAPAAAAPASPLVSSAPAELRAAATAPPPPDPKDLSAPAPAAPDDLSAPFLTRLTTSLRPQAAPLKPPPAPAARAAKAQADAKPPAAMFEQINAILQRKLLTQPNPPEIELYADEGELRILVGSDVFRQVEDVTDERARGWIREAVAEWEAG